MGKNRDQGTGANYDARILSLCSRGIGSGVPANFSGENVFYSFCYYDAIKVSPIPLSDCAQLKGAYAAACSMREETPDEIPQSIVAITDISSQPGTFGYTKERIRRFWKNDTAPIFFVSMLNLSHPSDMERILGLIEEKFPAESHLSYFSFDHCDIIIFGRGESFQQYTNCIFDLCYAGQCMPEDIITIYGFSNQRALYELPERETFQTCIRLGIRDYSALDQFAPKCAENSNMRQLLGKKISVSWLLGRNDVNLCCPDASLPWLRRVRNALIKSTDPDDPWFTTYDLTVLVAEIDREWKAPGRSRRGLDSLRNTMDRYYEAFKEAYTAQYRRLTKAGDIYYLDQMWCRWLRESSRLAISLIGSPLSSDFGTCLVPQFLDLLKYGSRLFGQELLSQAEIEKAHANFAEFFSNTAILVDSLNQTNRQFVQVPAFHLPSFEVPSQIMAYYTAMAYRILNVLKDKDDYFYGLSISPKLVNTLSVSSLAQPKALANDEWLSINMDEDSFYTLKLTTETLGHEISHFVGEDNRNREKRKECIIRWAFQELVGAWYLELNDRIPELFCLPGHQAEVPEQYPSWDALSSAAQELQALAQNADIKYRSEQNNHQDVVKDLILDIAEDVSWRIPQLREGAFEQIWKILCEDPAGQDLTERVRLYVRWEIGLDSPDEQKPNVSVQKWTVDELVKDRLKRLFYKVLEDTGKLFGPDGQCRNHAQREMLDRFQKQVCYQFSETFADLQAILLLDMKWNDYRMLLKRDERRELIPDCPPRMLAVTRALIDCKVWDPLKDPASFTDGGGEFDAVKELAFLPPEDFIPRLRGSGFDPILIHYLIEYLKTCVGSIQKYFKTEHCEKGREEIRDMYRMLSERPPMLTLQTAMLAFVRRYQEQCLDVK